MNPEIPPQPVIAFCSALEAYAIGPFAHEDFDEPLGFAVGAGRVGPDATIWSGKHCHYSRAPCG